MDLKPFKLDIDELINEFKDKKMTTLTDMKQLWLSRKFSFIFDASPSKNLSFFAQSLYAHSIGYLVSTASLSERLPGLYCLYCLYEVQPFKPPFKIYLSVGDLKRLRSLVADAKANNIKVVSALVKRMLEKNVFLFGSVDLKSDSMAERMAELARDQNTHIKVAHEKLFSNTRIEQFINMDLGMELEVNKLKNLSTEYAASKQQAIKEASEVVDVQNIMHIAKDAISSTQVVEKAAQEWDVQKELFYQQTGMDQSTQKETGGGDDNVSRQKEPGDSDDDGFALDLELELVDEDF